MRRPSFLFVGWWLGLARRLAAWFLDVTPQAVLP